MDDGEILALSIAELVQRFKERGGWSYRSSDPDLVVLVDMIARAVEKIAYAKGLRKGKSIGSHQAYNKFVKHGRWHEFKNSNPIRVACSECGHPVNWFWDNWRKCKYCPNCGAKMDSQV